MREIDEAKFRDQLQRQRDSLFETFRKHPSITRLAIEIRVIDDVIATLTKRLNARGKNSS
jgi:hypothetical protein